MAALEPHQRPVFAAAIFTGLRKGELCGLQKTDVDLPRRFLVARRSYDRPYPKSRKQRVVRIPDELVPFLEHAIATFPGLWLVPDDDGGMRTVASGVTVARVRMATGRKRWQIEAGRALAPYRWEGRRAAKGTRERKGLTRHLPAPAAGTSGPGKDLLGVSTSTV